MGAGRRERVGSSLVPVMRESMAGCCIAERLEFQLACFLSFPWPVMAGLFF